MKSANELAAIAKTARDAARAEAKEKAAENAATIIQDVFLDAAESGKNGCEVEIQDEDVVTILLRAGYKMSRQGPSQHVTYVTWA